MNNNARWNIETLEDRKEKRLRILRISISSILGIAGLLIIASQLFPVLNSYLLGKYMDIRAALILQPLPDNYKQYIQGEFAYYDPGKSYFSNLTQKVSEYTAQNMYTMDPQSNTLKEIVINQEYQGKMKLTIDSVGIKDVTVSSNVESSNEKVYNSYLKYGLAHFKGTPLPGDGGNSFIYGHSAVSTFFTSHPDLPETIFTRLENVDVGQKVQIKKDDKILSYTVRRKKIVEANDYTIFSQSGNKETVTLMTCWPIGIGSKRLIVIAEKDGS